MAKMDYLMIDAEIVANNKGVEIIRASNHRSRSSGSMQAKAKAIPQYHLLFEPRIPDGPIYPGFFLTVREIATLFVKKLDFFDFSFYIIYAHMLIYA